jgi:hypothetical protein
LALASNEPILFFISVNTNVPSTESYELTVASKRLLVDDLFTTTTELPAIYANCVAIKTVISLPLLNSTAKLYDDIVLVKNLSPGTPVGPV